MIYQPLAKISPVTEHISIGGLTAYGQLDELAKHQCVLNVAWELTDEMVDDAPMGSETMLPNGSIVFNARLDDNYDVESQEQEIFRAVGIVNDARARGERVLVTCAAGRNRSGIVIAEHLIQSEGYSAASAVGLLKLARRGALTNEVFAKWLMRPRQK